MNSLIIPPGKSKDPTCPHCLKAFHGAATKICIGQDADGSWVIEERTCPAFLKVILELAQTA